MFLDKYAALIVSAIRTAVDKPIPRSKSVRSESNPISDETIALIKEKRRFRRQYSQNRDPTVKTRINQLQKQVQEELRVERKLVGKNSATLRDRSKRVLAQNQELSQAKGSARLSNTAP